MNNAIGFKQQVEQIVFAHLQDEDFGNAKLCQLLGLSRMQVYRKIKQATNLSTNIFIRSIRLEKSKAILQSSEKTIRQIAFEVGFEDPAYFCRCFKKHFNRSPGKYRQAQQKER